MNFKRLLYFLIVILSFSGCSSEFVQPFPMPLIPQSEEIKTIVGTPEIYLQEIKDLRKSKAFFEHNASSYETYADIGPVVREALSKVFVKRGYRYSNKATFIFQINIKKWDAEIDESFPGSATAKAKIEMILLNRQGQKIYSGAYQGVATLESMAFSNEDITEVLGSSMQAAIYQLSHDQKLEQLLLKK